MNPLLIIFTLNNDRTQLYLTKMGLDRCFDEDNDLAVISFQRCLGLRQHPEAVFADLVLLYDGSISHAAEKEIAGYAAQPRDVYVCFHLGLETEADRHRIETQRKKLSAWLPNIKQPFLYQHSTCGATFDGLLKLADCIEKKNERGYFHCLQKLLPLDASLDLDWRLRVLHRCVSPGAAAALLHEQDERVVQNHTIRALLADLANEKNQIRFVERLTQLRDRLLYDGIPF